MQIRSAYRTVELSEGYQGYLAIHEVYFFTLDTLPLFLGVAIYVAIWPGRFVPSPPRRNSSKANGEGSEGYKLEQDDDSQMTAHATLP
jgi:RTA1 like protein